MTDAPEAAPRSRSPRAVFVALAAIVVLVGGVSLIFATRHSETTDNAYIRADMSVVASKVSGIVSDVAVIDGQHVAAGTVLARLDAEEYTARVAAAEADVEAASASVRAMEAGILRQRAETGGRTAAIDEALAQVKAADAESRRARAERLRYEELAARGLAPRQRVDLVDSTAAAADAGAERAAAALRVAGSDVRVSGQRGAEAEAQRDQAKAALAQADAALELARQNLAHATIVSPIDGVIANRRAERGEYVQPGAALMTVVPVSKLYVVANFKETQTGRMLAGQTVAVHIDALPGVKFAGRVESLAPGTGAEFGLLPFEPGSGNFTKIVQRVPVRITLAPSRDLVRLRPGLSAHVTVKTR